MSAEQKKAQRGKGTGSIFKPLNSEGVPRKYWCIAYMSGGIRRYESSRSVLKEDAQRLLAQRLGDSAKGIVVTPQVGKLTLLEGVKAVLDQQRQEGVKSVVDNERFVQRHVYKFFPSSRLMSTITTAEVRDYITHRQRQKAANGTINRELEILRQAFTKAARGGRLLGQPDITLLPGNVREVFFEPEEFESVLAALREKYPQFPEYVPILQFTCATGWRMTSEVLSLEVSQVDMAEGIVTLRIGSTKSGKGRIVPMTEETRRILTEQLKSVETLKKEGIICPYVFHRTHGKKRGQRIKTMRIAYTKAVEAAGLPHRTFHDIRRTGIRDMIRAGNSEAVTMKFSGHTTRAVFDRYNITSVQDMRVAAARMDAYKKKRSAVLPFKKRAAK